MDDRELLHWIVDQLPEGALDEARIAIGQFLEDPMMRNTMTAPLDDEPMTEGDRKAIERSRAGGRRTYTMDEVDELLSRAEVVWSADAVDELLDLASRERGEAQHIRRTLRQYARGERVDAKKLAGTGELRIRVGDWRVILVETGPNKMEVSRIRNRSEAYD
jgi:hypothetical protein